MNADRIFGKLERVELREIWEHESLTFTPWLAENLYYLGEAIGADLVLVGAEANVGMFRADILAKDEQTGKLVLIENQLERTDHCHLGQILTYAAGLKVSTMVWIASQFTDEHIAALDWLNSVVADTTKFFGVQIEAWRIENAIAPKLTVVSKPNSWIRRNSLDVKTETIEERDARLENTYQELRTTNKGKRVSGRQLADRAKVYRGYCTKWLQVNHPENEPASSEIEESDLAGSRAN